MTRLLVTFHDTPTLALAANIARSFGFDTRDVTLAANVAGESVLVVIEADDDDPADEADDDDPASLSLAPEAGTGDEANLEQPAGHECDECGRQFKTRHSLATHVGMMHGAQPARQQQRPAAPTAFEPLTCSRPACTFTCHTTAGLAMHLAGDHPEPLDPDDPVEQMAAKFRVEPDDRGAAQLLAEQLDTPPEPADTDTDTDDEPADELDDDDEPAVDARQRARDAAERRTKKRDDDRRRRQEAARDKSADKSEAARKLDAMAAIAADNWRDPEIAPRRRDLPTVEPVRFIGGSHLTA